MHEPTSRMTRVSFWTVPLALLALFSWSGLSPAHARTMRLCVDVSESMKGYAAGNGGYDRLWTHVIEPCISAEYDTVVTRTVGATIGIGPPANRVNEFADAAKYVHEKTALVTLFGDTTNVFPLRGRAENAGLVVVVSDLEPDVVDPDPTCRGSASVACLTKRLENLVEKGWNFTLLGFETPFRGRRFIPTVQPDGRWIHETPELAGDAVPVYILLADRDGRQALAFARSLRGQFALHSPSTRCSIVTLLPVSAPAGRIFFEDALRNVPWRDSQNQPHGVALIHSGGSDGDARADVKVDHHNHGCSFTLPIQITQPRLSDGAIVKRWRPVLRYVVTPPALEDFVHVRYHNFQVVDSTSTLACSVSVTIDESFLRAADRGNRPVVALRVLAEPEDPDVALWRGWSYQDAGVPFLSYKKKTFRTSEVLEALFKKGISGNRQPVVASLAIRFDD